jgi:adenosylcobinamide-GDP ribazoletransferase
MPFFRGMRAAFIFLTRIPVGGFPYSRADWVWACAHFPLVGLVLGALHGLMFYGLQRVGALPAGMLVLGASMMLTGAFHEDGLADTSDAMGGAFDRDKLQLILKDSRVGTFGAAALVFSIGSRAALWAEFAPHRTLYALIALSAFVSSVSRAFPVLQMVLMPYATEQGAKSRDVTRGRPAQALVAFCYPAMAAYALLHLHIFSLQQVLATFAICGGITLLTSYRYWVRLGGLAGDFLGATQQLCEIGALCVVAYRAVRP